MFSSVLNIKKMAMLFLFISFQSHAWECNILTPQFNISLPSSIDVQRDTANNQPITDWVSGGGVKDLYRCNGTGPGGARWNVIETNDAPKTGGVYTESGVNYNIFKTNLSGVGLIVRVRSKGAESLSSFYSFPYGRWISSMYVSDITTKFGVDARLIKIGTINADRLNSVVVGKIQAFGDSGKLNYPVNITVGSSQIKVLACSVNTPVVSVKFDKVSSRKDFKDVGYKLPSVSIPFTLSCNPGARVNVTVSGTKDTALGENGLIQIKKGDNMAKGIAIQIIDKNENGIELDKSFFSGTSSGTGLYELGLRARYVQTMNRVLPGTVSAVATISLTYN